MTTLTATEILAENGYTTDDFTACMLREAKKTALTNSSATGNNSGTSSSISVGPLSLSESSSISTSISAAVSINSPSNTIYREMLNNALERLRGRVFVRTR